MTKQHQPSPLAQLTENRTHRVTLDILLKNEGFWVTAEHIANTTALTEQDAQETLGDLDDIGLLETRGTNPEEVRLDDGVRGVQILHDAHAQLHAHLAACHDVLNDA